MPFYMYKTVELVVGDMPPCSNEGFGFRTFYIS